MEVHDSLQATSVFRKPNPSTTQTHLARPAAAPGPALLSPPPAGLETPGSDSFRRPRFHGVGGTLFGIHIVNVLLTLVTLGVYYFWAKTRVRQYLFGQTEIAGDRFAYHGNGKELLLGTLKAALIFGLPTLLLNLVRDVFDVHALIKVVAGLISGSLV